MACCLALNSQKITHTMSMYTFLLFLFFLFYDNEKSKNNTNNINQITTVALKVCSRVCSNFEIFLLNKKLAMAKSWGKLHGQTTFTQWNNTNICSSRGCSCNNNNNQINVKPKLCHVNVGKHTDTFQLNLQRIRNCTNKENSHKRTYNTH